MTRLAVDLHSHSGYSGGVGTIPLETISRAMRWKGLDVFGTGDCLHPARSMELREQLTETAEGLYAVDQSSARFLLQTEVILTIPRPGGSGKLVAHHVVLFPDFDAIRKIQHQMNLWDVKNTIGRPFVVCSSRSQLADRLHMLKSAGVEIIPAHIMTPDGVLGSKNNLDSMEAFYGEYLPEIRVIETGLSADPSMLEQIPELAALTMISSSDCHSAALHRIGREYTVLDVDTVDYPGILAALHKNQVACTAEFNPSEGRYYLTGHRGSRHPDGKGVFWLPSEAAPQQCPVCGSKMVTGVSRRCHMLQDTSLPTGTRAFLHLIPLTEVLAVALRVKNPSSKRVLLYFKKIMDVYGSEIGMWQTIREEGIEQLAVITGEKIAKGVLSVVNQEFRFDPPGFDGEYGRLVIPGLDG